MKITRLAKQATKRNKKNLFKGELKALREKAFIKNVPISADLLTEYQIAKETLCKLWYPNKYGLPLM
jgi:hypothetical protein